MTVKHQLRRLETLGRPVVAAMNGTALGGGLEIGLACHHRIGLDAKGVVYGLPEVTLGLLPGGGGVVRITRMLGIADGVHERARPGPAAQAGRGARDRDRRRAGRHARRRCSTRRGPGSRRTPTPPSRGTSRATRSPAAPRPTRSWPRSCRRSRPTCASSSRARRCRRRATSCRAAVEGAQVDIDTAFRIEARYFTELVTGQVAKNMTKAFFYDLQHINGGGSRPDGYETWQPTQGRRARRRDDGRGHRLRVRARRAGRSCSRTSRSRRPRRARPTPRAWSRRASSAGRPRRRRARRCSRGSPRPTTTTTSPAATSSSRRCSSRSSSSTRCSAEAVKHHRAGRPAVLQHLHAADHRAGRGRRPAGRLHRPALLLAGRQDAAGGDHPRRADLGRHAGQGVRRDARDEEDADRRQRQPRLLHQPGDRHVPQRGRRDARRGHRPADDRAGLRRRPATRPRCCS